MVIILLLISKILSIIMTYCVCMCNYGKVGHVRYGTLVDVKSLTARVGAMGPVLFMNGEGCDAYYKVKC